LSGSYACLRDAVDEEVDIRNRDRSFALPVGHLFPLENYTLSPHGTCCAALVRVWVKGQGCGIGTGFGVRVMVRILEGFG